MIVLVPCEQTCCASVEPSRLLHPCSLHFPAPRQMPVGDREFAHAWIHWVDIIGQIMFKIRQVIPGLYTYSHAFISLEPIDVVEP